MPLLRLCHWRVALPLAVGGVGTRTALAGQLSGASVDLPACVPPCPPCRPARRRRRRRHGSGACRSVSLLPAQPGLLKSGQLHASVVFRPAVFIRSALLLPSHRPPGQGRVLRAAGQLRGAARRREPPQVLARPRPAGARRALAGVAGCGVERHLRSGGGLWQQRGSMAVAAGRLLFTAS